MMKVWTDAVEAGLLDRYAERGSTFAYLPAISTRRAVSVTMPVRLPSWSLPFDLPPIFEMNLPEGFLREHLRLTFAKATGTFDGFDLLAVVGRSQIGRIRYTGDREGLNEDVPFHRNSTSIATKTPLTTSVTVRGEVTPLEAAISRRNGHFGATP